MYQDASETARLYKLLSEKLGNDTADAMFKYIDNKTQRSFAANLKTLAAADDVDRLRKEINYHKAVVFKWLLIFFGAQIVITLAVIMLA